MKGKHLAIYGSSGALPLWIDTANAIVNSTDSRKGCSPPISYLVLWCALRPTRRDFGGFRFSPVTGLPKRPSKQTAGSSPDVTVLSETEAHGEKLKLKRHFEPF